MASAAFFTRLTSIRVRSSLVELDRKRTALPSTVRAMVRPRKRRQQVAICLELFGQSLDRLRRDQDSMGADPPNPKRSVHGLGRVTAFPPVSGLKTPGRSSMESQLLDQAAAGVGNQPEFSAVVAVGRGKDSGLLKQIAVEIKAVTMLRASCAISPTLLASGRQGRRESPRPCPPAVCFSSRLMCVTAHLCASLVSVSASSFFNLVTETCVFAFPFLHAACQTRTICVKSLKLVVFNRLSGMVGHGRRHPCPRSGTLGDLSVRNLQSVQSDTLAPLRHCSQFGPFPRNGLSGFSGSTDPVSYNRPMKSTENASFFRPGDRRPNQLRPLTLDSRTSCRPRRARCWFRSATRGY